MSQHLSCFIVPTLTLDVSVGYSIRQCVSNHVVFEKLSLDGFIGYVCTPRASGEIVPSVSFPWFMCPFIVVSLEA